MYFSLVYRVYTSIRLFAPVYKNRRNKFNYFSTYFPDIFFVISRSSVQLRFLAPTKSSAYNEAANGLRSGFPRKDRGQGCLYGFVERR